jgi:hypothetical protein
MDNGQLQLSAPLGALFRRAPDEATTRHLPMKRVFHPAANSPNPPGLPWGVLAGRFAPLTSGPSSVVARRRAEKELGACASPCAEPLYEGLRTFVVATILPSILQYTTWLPKDLHLSRPYDQAADIDTKGNSYGTRRSSLCSIQS